MAICLRTTNFYPKKSLLRLFIEALLTALAFAASNEMREVHYSGQVKDFQGGACNVSEVTIPAFAC
jgi:hypothetical protein